jgi:GntR family transcriptional regulator
VTNLAMKAITAYQEVKQKITNDLVSGRFFMGQALPAEKDLAKELKVSIGTLRKAVDELVAEGIVIRRQGKGTYVAEHDEQRLLYYFFHVVKHNAEHKNYPKVELVSFQSASANQEEATKLAMKEGSPVWRIVNRLFLDQTCVLVDHITLSKLPLRNAREVFISSIKPNMDKLSCAQANDFVREQLVNNMQNGWI